MIADYQKLYSLPAPAKSIFTSEASNTLIIALDDCLYTPQGIINSVARVMVVRITPDGEHWVAALRMADDRYLVMLDGKEVVSYQYIYGSCAAISQDGKRWAVFADTEKGENCLVIDGIIYGPFFDSPPGAGYNAKPLLFDEQNVLWCPIKINEQEWVLSRDGAIASEARELWRDIGFQSGSMSCRSRKDNKWFVHVNDQEWGPYESAKDVNISNNQQYIAFAAEDNESDCVVLNGEIIHRNKRVMMYVHVTDDGKVLASTESKYVDPDFAEFFHTETEFNAEAYEQAVEAYTAATKTAALKAHIYFGDWVSEGVERCVALAISENGQHIAFVADRDNASFVGNQHQLWGPFDVLFMNPLVLNDGRIAWMNQYDNYIALCVDGIEITQVDAIYSGLREIKNGIGFIATKGNDVFWVTVE